MRLNKKIHFFALFFLLVLPACTIMALNTAANRIFQRHDISLTEKSYAAADFMIQNVRHYVGKNDLILMEPLIDLETRGMSSEFAKVIPYQIGTRFSQLGYKVDTSNVLPDQNKFNEDIGSKREPAYITRGTYRKDGGNISLFLQIMGAQSGKIYTHFDYTMPLNQEIGDLSKPEPQIYKTSP